MKYKYTEDDYERLDAALNLTQTICNGQPDIYQYHQNNLAKAIASFLLKPYKENKKVDH